MDSNHLPPRQIWLSAALTTILDLESGERHTPSYVVRLRPMLSIRRMGASAPVVAAPQIALLA
jgi:hypothetical protein